MCYHHHRYHQILEDDALYMTIIQHAYQQQELPARASLQRGR